MTIKRGIFWRHFLGGMCRWWLIMVEVFVVHVGQCVGGGGGKLRPWEEGMFVTRHFARVDNWVICIQEGRLELSRPYCAVS